MLGALCDPVPRWTERTEAPVDQSAEASDLKQPYSVGSNPTGGTFRRFLSVVRRDHSAMHPKGLVDEARRLYATGLTAADVARRMGLPWRTVVHWCREDRRLPGVDRTACPRCADALLDNQNYACLFGQYLGDGHITTSKRKVHCLSIFCADPFLRGLIHSDGCRMTNWARRPLPEK